MYKKRKTWIKAALAVALDLVIASGIVTGDYVASYRIPHALATSNTRTSSETPTKIDASSGVGTSSSTTQNASGTQMNQSTLTLAERFKDQFSDKIISTPTEYRSKNIAVTITKKNYDSQTIDHSNSGKHEKYGSNVANTLADIYVSDVTLIQTAFAQNTYGVGFTQKLSEMSANMKSILAVNGDSYNNNMNQNNGTVIRNGEIYRTKPTNQETCILYKDGTMKIYTPDQFDANQIIADGAWQSWVFGPSLLDEDGNAMTSFMTRDYLRESHPRTAIGYYEPGHYCLLVVDGRTDGYSRGMFLEEMSQLFANLGCKAAYNLDGGHCSFMTKDAKIINRPYKKEHQVADGIFICEPGGNGNV